MMSSGAYRENARPQMPARPRRSWWARTKTRIQRKWIVLFHSSKPSDIGFKYVSRLIDEVAEQTKVSKDFDITDAKLHEHFQDGVKKLIDSVLEVPGADRDFQDAVEAMTESVLKMPDGQENFHKIIDRVSKLPDATITTTNTITRKTTVTKDGKTTTTTKVSKH